MFCERRLHLEPVYCQISRNTTETSSTSVKQQLENWIKKKEKKINCKTWKKYFLSETEQKYSCPGFLYLWCIYFPVVGNKQTNKYDAYGKCHSESTASFGGITHVTFWLIDLLLTVSLFPTELIGEVCF